MGKMNTMKTMMAVAAFALASGCETATPAQKAESARLDRLAADDWARYHERPKREWYLIHHGWHQQQTGYDFQTDECGRLQVYPHYELQRD